MPQGRCSRCFKLKDIQSVLRYAEVVCRGCFIEVDAVQGWLERQGYTLVHAETGEIVGMQLSLAPSLSRDTPPKPPADPQEAIQAVETVATERRVRQKRTQA